MIIKTWIGLTIVATLIQTLLAVKRVSHFIGLLVPFAFFLFAVYAWADLRSVGITINVLLSFFIPPIFLLCQFELVYWKKCWKEMLEGKEKPNEK